MRIMLRLFGALLLLILCAASYIYFSSLAKIPESRFAPDNSSTTLSNDAPVLLFGATRNTGLEFAKQLSARGEKIVAFVRPSSDITELEALGAQILQGDAMDAESIKAAFASQPFRAVMSTVGCFSCDPPVDFTGNKNIIDAAKAANVPKMMFISTIGAGDSKETLPRLPSYFLRGVLPLKTQAEDYLKASGLDYIIIRPGGLGSDPATGAGLLSEDIKAFGYIDRIELASLMLACIDSPSCTNKTLAAIDEQKKLPW